MRAGLSIFENGGDVAMKTFQTVFATNKFVTLVLVILEISSNFEINSFKSLARSSLALMSASNLSLAFF